MWVYRAGAGCFPGGLGASLKSCRQVDFLCLPIWMGSYPLEIFPIVVNRVCKTRLKTFFTTEEYFQGIANTCEITEQSSLSR